MAFSRSILSLLLVALTGSLFHASSSAFKLLPLVFPFSSSTSTSTSSSSSASPPTTVARQAKCNNVCYLRYQQAKPKCSTGCRLVGCSTSKNTPKGKKSKRGVRCTAATTGAEVKPTGCTVKAKRMQKGVLVKCKCKPRAVKAVKRYAQVQGKDGARVKAVRTCFRNCMGLANFAAKCRSGMLLAKDVDARAKFCCKTRCNGTSFSKPVCKVE